MPRELLIEGLVVGGRGLARDGGMVWLVEGALPGDLAEVEPVRVHPRFVAARATRIVRPSDRRREAACAIQSSCGGCPWMTLDEGAQREWKRALLTDALSRIGGVTAPRVEETVHAPPPLGYRNKIELSFGLAPGGERAERLGFHPPGAGERVVDATRCEIVDDAMNRALAASREFFLDGPGSDAPALLLRAEPTRLVLRRSAETGALLVALRGGAGPFPEASGFAAFLRARVPEVASVVRIVAVPGRRGGARTIPLSGPPWIEDRLAGQRFRLPAATFCQVNPGAADRLAREVDGVASVGRGARVLDLYGGVGVFAFVLARRGAEVTVVEADPEAVACGRLAAGGSPDLAIRFERADVGRFLARAPRNRSRPYDLLLADPPRTGLGRGVAAAIGALRPPRIVLVSCDPATLGRDVRALTGSGYRLDRAIPVDMFPQTPHVEAVAALTRDRG